jgi:hypothetical protein
MAFSIEEFKSNALPLGGARPNLFRVEMQFPDVVGGGSFGGAGGGIITPDQGAGYKCMFLCMASTLPAGIISEMAVPYFGRTIKYKGDRTYRDWNVTVLNEEDFFVRDTFENWQNTMNFPESNVMAPEYQPGQLYKTNCTITQFAKADTPAAAATDLGQVVKQYTMVGTWPKVVGDIQMSWQMQNTIEQFDVTLCYDYWLPIGPADGLQVAVSL